MPNLLVYPFGRETAPLVRNLSLTEYENIYAVSPKSFGYDMKDASFVDGGDTTGVIVTDDFESALKCCDTVLFDENNNLTDDEYVAKIELCSLYNRHIITKKNANILSTQKNSNNLALLDFPDGGLLEDEQGKLQAINVPVVCVFGAGERCNKFDIQLFLRNAFLNDGYAVSQLGTKWYSDICGFPALPKFLFENISFPKKVLLLNSYIKNIATRENPDVLIIGVPGGIMPLSDHTLNCFGELSSIISMATRPDIAILSVYASEYSDSLLSNLATGLKYKTGCPVDCINMANTNIILSADTTPDVSYLTIDNAINSMFTERSDSPNESILFNVLSRDSMWRVYENILDNLTNNIRIIS